MSQDISVSPILNTGKIHKGDEWICKINVNKNTYSSTSDWKPDKI